ncbi:MAG TPA: VOC family protein [Solirubrobacterales bacterium]|nr:VOC family protein [Solirubrobacterales bacterium]
MLAGAKAFSGFAVDDIDAARQFYGETLGLEVKVLDEQHGLITIKTAAGEEIFVYAKSDHAPANFTLLNFEVDDIDPAVAGLTERGVAFERYDGFDHDEKGIARGPGPQIAWFKDPAGNTLSVLQQPG